jgi:hypothetical protein
MTIERGYRRPTWVRVHFWNPLARFMIRRGLAPGGKSADGSGLRVLEVRGRKTGRLYQHPVAVAAVAGQRYIVSLWGESQWARNLRARPQRTCGSAAGPSRSRRTSWRAWRRRPP